MPRLQTLKPRVAMQEQRRVVEIQRPGATARLRGSAWMKVRYGWLCAHPACADCGRIHLSNQVDHVVPLWDGGLDDVSNYATRCVECHEVKTTAEAARRGGGGSNLW